ncbi:DUF2213 domain-containing protein [Salmonella enterica subsp. enterica serovar Muenchen]|uniref:DUF2213 domain-containing protein n=4 Tax=Salmonella enterica TaxID=28901 RepID=A0A5U3CVC1_SALDZ|nr:DUF2213 domain-containing protein [Salmonella enterica]EAA7932750.1 DUF2213 domain-containing protein [Salmonella enterica subsp. enterica serovar Redlands]EAB9741108.1 DUF2213 domain-containing protein [Salmonella enterica subsp. diarizonae]EBS4767585.1 DUF2213 domain-containing protein [Salmonella enterica subsp. enterica serovar Sandiego]EBW8697080.1 DUF2213 domain-containing protein [Salmonella enterica subsp. diarizonae serovar 16:z10:e,n,x,z15]EBW9332842.1 DUF2213 domain-containing pr
MTWKRTAQGYVITTATITRAGPIEYYGYELGLTGSDANKKITVVRTLDELSKPETLASFNGLPFTITHPDDGEVTAADHKDKASGHIANTRIEGGEVVCDVFLTDAAAIETLEETGIREVSVGYEPAELEERGGKFYHINIRGNHVAGVAEGRYGPQCKLNDKKGKPMFKTLTDALSFLKGKKLKDADGAALTPDELVGMIAALEKALEDLNSQGTEEAAAQAQQVLAQLAELKSQLEGVTSSGPTDADESGAGDDKDAKITALEAENEQLKTENQQLKEELEKLKAGNETESTLNDAKARFPKVNFNDAKSARDVRSAVLVSTKAFNDAQVKAMTDSEVRAAYAAIQATSKPRSEIGTHLFNDSANKSTKTATQRLGGK